MYGVGTAVGTAGHSTGVLPDTVRMFQIQYGCSGYSADVPDTARICRSTVLNKIQANEFFLMNQGKLAMSGKYDEIIEKSDLFKSLI